MLTNKIIDRRPSRRGGQTAPELALAYQPPAEDVLTDANSEYYVPPELREFYDGATDPDTEAAALAEDRTREAAALLSIRRALANDPHAWERILDMEDRSSSDTRSRLPGRMERHGPWLYTPSGGVDPERVESLTAEDLGYWVHNQRLTEAHRRAGLAKDERQREERRRAAVTCAVCGAASGRRFYVYLDAAIVGFERHSTPDAVAVLCGKDRVALAKALEARVLSIPTDLEVQNAAIAALIDNATSDSQ